MNEVWYRGEDYERKIQAQADMVERIRQWRALVAPIREQQVRILSVAAVEVTVHADDSVETRLALTEEAQAAMNELEALVQQTARDFGLTVEQRDWSAEEFTGALGILAAAPAAPR